MSLTTAFALNPGFGLASRALPRLIKRGNSNSTSNTYTYFTANRESRVGHVRLKRLSNYLILSLVAPNRLSFLDIGLKLSHTR